MKCVQWETQTLKLGEGKLRVANDSLLAKFISELIFNVLFADLIFFIGCGNKHRVYLQRFSPIVQ